MPHPRGCCQVWSWMLLNVTLLGPASLGRWGLLALCRHKLPSSCFKLGQEAVLLDAMAKRSCATWDGHPVTVFSQVEFTSFSFLILKPGLILPRLAHTVVYQRLSSIFLLSLPMYEDCRHEPSHTQLQLSPDLHICATAYTAMCAHTDTRKEMSD